MTIRILVVDDSPFICRLLAAKLQTAPDLEVIGTAHDSEEAVAKVIELKPDVVTLDQTMPGAGGLFALENIMFEQPTPVVMISGISSKAATLTRQALEHGAVDFVLKYVPKSNIDPDILYREIIAKVRAAAKIKVVRSLRTGAAMADAAKRPAALVANGNGSSNGNGHRQNNGHNAVATLPKPNGILNPLDKSSIQRSLAFSRGIVVIGASTGGPLALRELIMQLPANYALPIVVVQHIPASFTDILADHINKYVSLTVVEAKSGDFLESGKVYVAPGDKHLLFSREGQICLQDGPPVNGHRPSVDVTMQSAAERFGSHTRGVILTGMGDDGAMGMVSIRGKGGKTFAQNEESCVVFGMPQQAIARGIVEHIAEPTEIGLQLSAG